MGEDLAQRRRIIASMFGSNPESAPPSSLLATLAPGGPISSARASQVLSAKTLFIPREDPEQEPPAPQPNPRRWTAIFWVSIGMAVALALGLSVSSWLTYRRKAAQRAAAISTPAPPPPATIPSLTRRPSTF